MPKPTEVAVNGSLASIYDAFRQLTTNRSANRGTIEIEKVQIGEGSNARNEVRGLKCAQHKFLSGKVKVSEEKATSLRDTLSEAVKAQINFAKTHVHLRGNLSSAQETALTNLITNIDNELNVLLNDGNVVLRKNIGAIIENVDDLVASMGRLTKENLQNCTVVKDENGKIRLNIPEGAPANPEDDRNVLIIGEQGGGQNAAGNDELIPADLRQNQNADGGVKNDEQPIPAREQNQNVAGNAKGKVSELLIPADETNEAQKVEGDVKVEGAAEVKAPAGGQNPAKLERLKLFTRIAANAFGKSEGTNGGKGYMGLTEDGTPIKFLTHSDERSAKENLTEDVIAFVNNSTDALIGKLKEIALDRGQEMANTVGDLLQPETLANGAKVISREKVALAIKELASGLVNEKGEPFNFKGVKHAGTYKDSSFLAMYERAQRAKDGGISLLERTKAANPEASLRACQIGIMMNWSKDKDFHTYLRNSEFDVRTFSQKTGSKKLDFGHVTTDNPYESIVGGATEIAAKQLQDANGKLRTDVDLYLFNAADVTHPGGYAHSQETSIDEQISQDCPTLISEFMAHGYAELSEDKHLPYLWKNDDNGKRFSPLEGGIVPTKIVAQNNSTLLKEPIPVNLVQVASPSFSNDISNSDVVGYFDSYVLAHTQVWNDGKADRMDDPAYLNTREGQKKQKNFFAFSRKLWNQLTDKSQTSVLFRALWKAVLLGKDLDFNPFADDSQREVTKVMGQLFDNPENLKKILKGAQSDAKTAMESTYQRWFSGIKSDWEAKHPDLEERKNRQLVVQICAVGGKSFNGNIFEIADSMGKMAVLCLGDPRENDMKPPKVTFANYGGKSLMAGLYKSAFRKWTLVVNDIVAQGIDPKSVDLDEYAKSNAARLGIENEVSSLDWQPQETRDAEALLEGLGIFNEA